MIWIDIDNPPQAQYLLPFKEAFQQQGCEVTVTARDYSNTFDVLRSKGVEFLPCGRAFGKNRFLKAGGTINRAVALVAKLARRKPAIVISSSRSSALAAKLLNIPSFVIIDYEFAELGSFRRLGSYLIFPEVIGPDTFLDLGFTPERLIPFSGIKEDISFSNVDFPTIRPHSFDIETGSKSLVLFRPPATQAHYYDSGSGDFAGEVLKHLAAQNNVVVIFSPRYSSQVEMLAGHNWVHPPVVLDKAVEFVSLLKAVDAVVASGGTMIREAAYLGVPAFSIFKGRKGAVDKSLEAEGKLTFIETSLQMEQMKFPKRAHGGERGRGASVLDGLVAEILRRSN